MAQHFFSLFRYNQVSTIVRKAIKNTCTYKKDKKQILFCDFINGTEPVLLVGVDIIIFDIGLFHSLWGIDSCVAQHLDGGYGRFMWCVCHILTFAICLPFAFVSRPRPYSLWPLLIQQSAYGVGLLILSLAALPRVLPTFTGDQNSASLLSVSIYATGASLNFFLLYIYWHWYWHVEAMWEFSTKATPQSHQFSKEATHTWDIARMCQRYR
uniref:Bm8377 n=1 Tax=Brugia malayi TaxID=6279 RepID=A0A0H5S1A1_BRUMA|nr:Bm8377 [Brugia malayi]